MIVVVLCFLRYIPRLELFAKSESLGLQVFKTNFFYAFLGSVVVVNMLMPLLWYIEWEVRRGNNQTYTSKSQKWHIPSKATKITWTCYINEIETKQNKTKQTNKQKTRHDKIFQ